MATMPAVFFYTAGKSPDDICLRKFSHLCMGLKKILLYVSFPVLLGRPIETSVPVLVKASFFFFYTRWRSLRRTIEDFAATKAEILARSPEQLLADFDEGVISMHPNRI